MSDNWWANDPVAQQPTAAPAADQWWANDPVAPPAKQQPGFYRNGQNLGLEHPGNDRWDNYVAPPAEDPGLGTVAWDALRRGYVGLKQSGPTAGMHMSLQAMRQMDDVEQALRAGTQEGGIPIDRDPMGFQHMTQEQRDAYRASFQQNASSNIVGISQLEAERKALPQAPKNVEEALKADTWGGFWDHFKKAPVTFITSVGLESLPQMAPGLAAAVPAGMVAGPAGAAVAMGLGSAATDFLGKLREGLAEEGVDWSNPEAVEVAVKDQALMSRVLKRAQLHAAAVGTFDALSMGAASKTLAPKVLAGRPLAREMTNLGVQMPVQGGMGAAGEVAGSALSGDKINPGEVGAEFFGEFISAPADVLAAALSRGRVRARGARPASEPAPDARAAEEDAAAQKAMADFEAFMKQVDADPVAEPAAPAGDTTVEVDGQRRPDLEGRVAQAQQQARPSPETGEPTPEPIETLQAQQEQLLAGDRAAQMFPAGHPELPVPEGMERVETDKGDVFHFDPEKLSPIEIMFASAEGRENELLGLGSVPKTEAMQRAAQGEPPAAVVERTPEGVEVRGAAGTQQTAPAQVAEMQQVASPGNTVQVEDPARVVADRVAGTFKTAKGSVYRLHDDGTTSRDKAYRPEHGAKEQGPQPRSQRTFYVTEEDAQKLGEFQTRGVSKSVAALPDGRIGVRYEEGKDKGRFEKRTVVSPQSRPAQGLVPVEIWNDGRRVHFGNPITEVSSAAPINRNSLPGITPNFPEPDVPRETEREPASWVVRDKATGEPVLETFDPKVAQAINTAKYEVVPILEHLQDFNRRVRDAGGVQPPARNAVEAPGAVAPKGGNGTAAPQGVTLRNQPVRTATKETPVQGVPVEQPAAEPSVPVARGKPVDKPARKRQRRPLSLMQFIGRHGGLELNSDTRAMGWDKVLVPGGGPLARRTGRSIDGYWREALAEAGYLQNDPDGYMSRDIKNELHELITAEQAGRKTYSVEDQHTVDQQAELDERALEVERAAQDIIKGLADIGYTRDQINTADLYEAAELFYNGEVADPIDAFDQVATARAREAINAPDGEAIYRDEPQADPAGEQAGEPRQEARASGARGRDARSREDGPDEELYSVLPTKPGERQVEGNVGAARYEIGRSLTPEQRKKTLASLVDVYKSNGLEKEYVGTDRNGNERFAYPYSPDLFEKSDITGAMVRYYVTLPDGRIAHPTELFPNYKLSDIQAEMNRRAAAARNLRDDVKRYTTDQFDSLDDARRHWDRKSEESKSQSAGGWPLYSPSSERIAFNKDGKFILLNKDQAGRGDVVEAIADAGWRRHSAPKTEPVRLDKGTPGERQVEPPPKRFEYGLTLRPASHSTVPPGYIEFGKHKDFPHGTVIYDKPPKFADVEHFDLVPLDPKHPLNLRKAREAFRAKFAEEFAEANEHYEMVKGTDRRVIGKNISGDADAPWRITFIDKDGPSGHMEFSNFDELSGYVQGYAREGFERRIRARAEPKTEPVRLDKGTGEQFTIPGAEKEGQGTQAQRKADAPLKPKVAQKPMDVGLFGDSKNQGELFSVRGERTTDTPAFKRWFGDSKVVDEDGKPLVVYHGSPDARGIVGEDGKFATLKERLLHKDDPERAYFFTDDKRTAATYADDRRAFDYQNAEPATVPTFLSIKNPLVVDNKGARYSGPQKQDDLIAKAKADGHDGIIIRNTIDTYSVDGKRKANIYIAFDPTQIKSVNNRGTFDPADPRILFSVNAPGFYSSVARAIESAKQTKAPAGQWMGMIRNAPGVKPEELTWLGVEEWLKEQNGAVTKDALLDYVRANQVDVKEVEKGDGNQQEVDALEIERAAIRQDLDEARLQIRGAPDRESRLDRVRELADRVTALSREISAAQGQPTKFSSYTLPGGERYRELLLTLPVRKEPTGRFVVTDGTPSFNMAVDYRSEAEDIVKNLQRSSTRPLRIVDDLRPSADNYQSSHWDEPNVLAHVRFDDRVIDGKKSLHIAEFQSDWHQAGKRKGYDDPKARVAVEKKLNDAGYPVSGEDARLAASDGVITEQEAALLSGRNYVPDAPFKTTWPELLVKRMIRYAAENGYDTLSWDTGEVQAARYDLSKQIKEIEYVKVSGKVNGEQVYRLAVVDINGRDVTLSSEAMPISEIEETLGKEIAKKIEAGEGRKYRGHDGMTLEGLDLKVGGEGMLGFYDDILPATVNKLVKKYGARVGRGEIVSQDNILPEGGRVAPDRMHLLSDEQKASLKPITQPVHTLPITPALREAALSQGFPLFNARADLSEKAQEARGELESKLTQVIRRVAGDNVSVAFPDEIALPGSAAKAWGSYAKGRQTAAGKYVPADRLIAIALRDPSYRDPGRTAMHEAFHAVEDVLLSDKELDVLKRAEPRLRKIAQDFAKLSDKQAKELAPHEVRAIAFESSYFNPKALPPTVQRIYEKLRQTFERMGNAIRGLGFKSAEDVFTDAYLGRMAGRSPRAEGRFTQPAASVTENPAFKKWFRNSKVVDADGNPRVVYHGTQASDDFDRFKRRPSDIGIHFGTADQANDRIEYMAERARPTDGMRIIPAYLSIQNPVRLKDAGAWNADNLGYQLRYKFSSPDDQNRIRRLKTSKDIREFLRSKGYDGVVYKNEGETAGASEIRAEVKRLRDEMQKAMVGKHGRTTSSFSKEDQENPAYKAWRAAEQRYMEFRQDHAEDSYIAFEREQIKSVNNRGTFDASDPRILASVRDTGPSVDPVALSKLIRGELAKADMPKGRGWSEVDKFLAQTFSTEERARMGSAADAALSGDPELLDALSKRERSILEQIMERGGSKPPPKPPAPASSGGKDKTPLEYVLERIAPEDGGRLPTLNEIYTMAKDDLNPLRQMRDELLGPRPKGEALRQTLLTWEGRKDRLPTERDPYKLARLTRGSYGKAEQMLNTATFSYSDLSDNGKGLREILKPVSKDLNGFRGYIASRRALELAGRGIKTGISLAKAAAVVRDGSKYADTFAELVAYQRRTLDYLRDSGIIGPQAYAAMVQANKDYVPFYRLLEESGTQGMFAPGGLRVKDPIKRIKGSERKIIDPIESIIKNTYLYIGLAERNRALLAMDDLAKSSPKGEKLWTAPEQKPAPAISDNLAAFLNESGIEASPEAFQALAPDAFKPTRDTVAFFRDGKREVRKVPSEVAEAVNNMDRESIGLLFRILAAPARWLRAGATLAPEFIVRNPVRDQWTAAIYAEKGYIPIWDMVLGMKAVFRNEKGYQDWLKSGGANAAMVSIDRKYIDENVMRLRKPGVLNRLGNVVTQPIQMLRLMSELTESATRVGIYTRARKRGASMMEGGFSSREGTLDFARKGAQMRAVNAIIAFFNAQLEGTDREIRGIAKRPMRSLVLIGGLITLPSILLWFANHDDDRWKELPQWQKDLFWIVTTDDWKPYEMTDDDGKRRAPTDEEMEPRKKLSYYRKRNGKWEINDGTLWRIPKPFALGLLFGSVPERVLDAYYDQKPEAFKHLSKAIADAFIPSYLPQVIVPGFEQFANRSTFTDRNIIPGYLKDVLPEYQATPYSSDVAKLLGKGISKLGLDMEYSSFSSPMVIDNYIRAWSGGLGVHVTNMADKALRETGVTAKRLEPTATWADTPVAKAFAVRHPSSSAQSIQDFYDEYEKRKRAHATVRFLSKKDRDNEADTVLSTRNTERAESVKNALGKQLRFIHDIYENPKLSADDKRRLIDETYRLAADFAREGLETFAITRKDLDERRRSTAK